jgi:hypothetical protein
MRHKALARHRASPAQRQSALHLRAKTTSPAGAPKPSRPGPGRPPGRCNDQPTRRYDVHLATTTDSKKPQAKKRKSTNPRPRRTG